MKMTHFLSPTNVVNEIVVCSTFISHEMLSSFLLHGMVMATTTPQSKIGSREQRHRKKEGQETWKLEQNSF